MNNLSAYIIEKLKLNKDITISYHTKEDSLFKKLYKLCLMGNNEDAFFNWFSMTKYGMKKFKESLNDILLDWINKTNITDINDIEVFSYPYNLKKCFVYFEDDKDNENYLDFKDVYKNPKDDIYDEADNNHKYTKVFNLTSKDTSIEIYTSDKIFMLYIIIYHVDYNPNANYFELPVLFKIKN